MIIGAKAPITEIELVNTLPHTVIVNRPFTVQKMAEAISAVTGIPVPLGKATPVARPAAPAAVPAAPKTPALFERPSFVR